MLFHLSTELPDSDKPKQLIPRIPTCRERGEDDTIPRICFSNSVLGCLKAIPDSYDGVYNRIYLQKERGIPVLFALYGIEEQELPIGFLRTPNELQELVPDAIKNQEYWVTDITLNLPLYGYIWVKDIQQDKEKNLQYCTFEFSQTTKPERYHFTFIYQSEWLKMKELIKKYQGRIIEERAISVNDDCAFSEVYTLDFEVPVQTDMREIWQTYYEIRVFYDDELFEEDFSILQTY